MRALHILGVLCLLCASGGASYAQVRCKMPNGVIITQQLGACPRDAVELSPGGNAAPGSATASPAKPQIVTAVASPKPGVAPAPSSSGNSFPMFAWVLIVGLGAALVFAIKGSGGTSGPPQFCTTCGHEGPAKTKTRGSTAVELVLWLFFLVPGLIYSVWRLSSKHKVCASCGSSSIVPRNSPVALAAKRNLAQ